MERRKSRRKAVRGLNEIMVSAQDGPGVACRILDLSPHGMRLSFSNASHASGIVTGGRLQVGDCPELLAPLLVERGLLVVWTEERACGVRFDIPLRCALDEWEAGAKFVTF